MQCINKEHKLYRPCCEDKKLCKCGCAIATKHCEHLEKAMATMLVCCIYMKEGCNEENLALNEKHAHEYTCSYEPWPCPVLKSNFLGPSLYDHIHNNHCVASEGDNAIVTIYFNNQSGNHGETAP